MSIFYLKGCVQLEIEFVCLFVDVFLTQKKKKTNIFTKLDEFPKSTNNHHPSNKKSTVFKAFLTNRKSNHIIKSCSFSKLKNNLIFLLKTKVSSYHF
jgi:hypothetical protein